MEAPPSQPLEVKAVTRPQPLEEVKAVTRPRPLEEDKPHLGSKEGLEEFSPLVAEEPTIRRLQLGRATLALTLEPRLQVLHPSTSQAELGVEQPEPPVRPTCSDSPAAPPTSRTASPLPLLSSEGQEGLLQGRAGVQCSVSEPEVTSPEPPPHRGGLPPPGGRGNKYQ